MGSTSEETMDYTMVATTATTSFTTSYANGYGTSGSCPSSSSPQASSFRPYFPVSGSDDHLRTTSSYSGTIMSSTTTDPTPYEPLVVRPMHKDSGYTESGSHPHPHHHSPHHPHHPHHHRHRVSPYPTSPYDRPQEEVDTKPSLPSPRCPLGPSPLPPMSPSAKSPDQPEKTVNYEELRMKIAYKKFERDCIMEFDGDTVLCRVCGDKASGFHYGVHACEGCKGFFRRSIQQKIQYRPCLKNQQCNIMRVNRNRCQYCRLKKCIAVGMSRDAVRFGRVPKKEKAKILEQMAKVNQQSQLALLSAVLDQEPPRQFVQKIVEAHLAIAPYTFAKFAAFYKQTWAEPSYVDCPAHMACPLKPAVQDDDGVGKWEDFTDSFTPAIRNVVSFAKQIPGFTVFNQEDQVTLLKAGTFEVLLLHLACLFDTKSNTMMFTNGKLFKRSSSSSGPVSPLGAAPGSSGAGAGAGFLLDSMFDFAERLVELKLSDEEMALFCAMVIIAPDRPGLRNAENIERVQTRISSGLHSIMAHRRSSPSSPEAGDSGAYASLLAMIPDLRTLNQLHSEKLGNLTVPDRPVVGGVRDDGMVAEKFEKLEKCPFPEANVGGLSGMSGMSGAMSGMASPHMLPPPPAPAPSTATSEAVVLQTSMGTFHRYSMSPPPAPPRTLSTASSRSSPDPLEMDMHPSPPPLLPVGRETAEGGAGANPPPTTHPHHHPHKPPALESLQADMHNKMAQLYNLWEFDMRSNRSNSLSSTSSTESGGSVDSAYRSAPATPPRHPDDVPATSGSNSASVLKQALSMPPLVAQHTWFHHPPGPQSSAPRTSSSQDLHRSVLELSRRAAHEAMKSGPAPAGPYNPVAAAAAAAMMYQQQQQYAAAAAMQHYMHAATAMPQHHSAAQAQHRQHSVPPPPSSAPFLPLESGGPLNLSTPKAAAPLSPSMPKVKVEPL